MSMNLSNPTELISAYFIRQRFHNRCRSWRNPPNLSGLGTGTGGDLDANHQPWGPQRGTYCITVPAHYIFSMINPNTKVLLFRVFDRVSFSKHTNISLDCPQTHCISTLKTIQHFKVLNGPPKGQDLAGDEGRSGVWYQHLWGTLHRGHGEETGPRHLSKIGREAIKEEAMRIRQLRSALSRDRGLWTASKQQTEHDIV